MAKRQKFTVLHNLPKFADLDDQKAGTSSDRRPGDMVTLDPSDDSTQRLLKYKALTTYKPEVGETEDAPAPKSADDVQAVLVKALESLDTDADNNFDGDYPKTAVVNGITGGKYTKAQIKSAWDEVTA